MARDLAMENFYESQTKQIPLRWTAPEVRVAHDMIHHCLIMLVVMFNGFIIVFRLLLTEHIQSLVMCGVMEWSFLKYTV